VSKVSELKFTIQDRIGQVEVVELKHVLELERQLNVAKEMIRAAALKLLPEPGTSILDVIDDIMIDANTLDSIDRYGLCVSHARLQGKIDKGEEWTVQTDDYSELFSGPNLEDVVKKCVDRIQKKLGDSFVNALLTKKD
jgi:hypothetical protein